MWLIFIVIGVIVIGFIVSVNKDNAELAKEPLEKKFSLIISHLNDEIFNGQGKLYIIDKRAFNLHDGSNQIVQFLYSSGHLTITWRYKIFDKEIIHKRDFNQVRNITSSQQRQIANTFATGVVKLKESNNLITGSKGKDASLNDFDAVKFKIVSAFNQFCYSSQYTSLFLKDSEKRMQIAEAIYISGVQKENFLISLFRSFLEKGYGISLENKLFNTYDYKDYTVYLDVERVTLDNNYTYFEILMNDFEGIKDSNGNKLTYVTQLVLYAKNVIPIYLFTVVFDPYLEKYAIREVFDDGESINLGFVLDNENDTISDFLKKILAKKKL